MPVKYSKQFVKKIYGEKWLETTQINHSLIESVSKLMIKLAGGGCKDESLILVRAMLYIKLSDPISTDTLQKPIRIITPILDDYWFSKVLNDVDFVFEKFPQATTMLCVCCVKTLIFYENIRKGDRRSKTDESVRWRPAIEDHEQNFRGDFRSQLIGKLGSFIIELGRKSMSALCQVLNNISKIDYPVFRRLELHVYQSFPEHFKVHINCAIVDNFSNARLHHEYFRLLDTCFPYATNETRAKYLEYVESGPASSQIKFWETQVHMPIFYMIKLWKFSNLIPIRKHLTNEEEKKFKKFLHGNDIPNPDFLVSMQKVESQESEPELNDNLNCKDVFKVVKTYVIKQLQFGHIDRMPVKFENFVCKNSKDCSSLALDCLDLNSVFRHSFLEGIRTAIEQSKIVNWEPLLLLFKEIVNSAKTSKNYESCDVVGSAVLVLKVGLRQNSIDFVFRDKVWELLAAFVMLKNNNRICSDDHPFEVYTTWSSSELVDYNTFCAIIHYIIWCEKQSKCAKFFDLNARKLLTRYLEQKILSTAPRHAALGRYLNVLYYYDSTWIKDRLNNLFMNRTNEHASRAWEEFVLYSNVSEDIFVDLAPLYRSSLEEFKQLGLKDGKLPPYAARIIIHVTHAYLCQFNGSDDIFAKMLECHPEIVHQHCANAILDALKQNAESPVDVFDISRFKEIWKSNWLITNTVLLDWVKYSPLTKELTLNLLYNSLKSLKMVKMFPLQLVEYAETHPQLALRCLELIIRKKSQNYELSLVRKNLKRILVILLKKPETKNDATTLIHQFGELGLSEYRDLLST